MWVDKESKQRVSKGASFTSLPDGSTTSADMLGAASILGRDQNTHYQIGRSRIGPVPWEPTPMWLDASRR